MHVGLLLALAGQVTPIASPEAVDARGAKDVVFRAPSTGMYRVRVTSDAGTSCAIADHLRGPFAFSGEVGTKSCDVDLMLEASLYKARLRSPEKGKGKAKLELIPFSDVMAPVRLDEGRQIEVRVKPREQMTTWLRAEKRQSVTVEVAGRTVGRIALWRDGQWLEDVPMDHTESMPRAGKAIHRWRMDRVLEPGDYKLVIYGSEAKAWTKGPEEDVAFITRGAPSGSAARSQAFSIPAWGFTQIAVPFESIGAFIQLDQSGTEPVRMRAEPVRRDALLGAVRSKGGSTCTIAAGQPVPSCALTEGAGSGGSFIVTIDGPPGTRGDLMWGPMASWNTEGFWWNGNPEWQISSPGTYVVSAPPLPLSMDAEPLSCAIDQISEDRGEFIRRVAVDAPAVSWTTPFERAFNYTATSTAVWVNIEKPGLYEIKGDDPVKASCEIFKIDGWNRTRVGEGEDGKCNSKKALSSGIHEIRFYGGRPGIQKLRIAQLGLGGVSPATQAKASCTFPNVELTRGRYRMATSSNGGANLRALMARPSPGALDVAVPFAVDPGRPLTLSLTSGSAIVARTRAGLKIACTIDGASLPSSGGVCQSGPLTSAATLTITNNEQAPILVMVGRAQPPPPVPAPPRFDPVTMKLPNITAGRMQWMDFDRDQERSMIVTVDKPGLYDLESEGLLSTTCRLRTPTIGNLADGNANGRGRNCLVRGYLKPGTYLFSAQAHGNSTGRAGIRLAQRPPRDLGAVPVGEEVFFRVPAGELAQQTFELKKAGTLQLATSAQGAQLSCRIDDHDGWPLTAVPTHCAQSLDLDEGRYLLTALPLTVDSRRRTSVQKAVEEVVLEGETKTHALALNQKVAAQLGKDGKDSFTFTLGADMEVGIELTRAMQGRLSRVGKDAKGAVTREVIETIPPVGGGAMSLGRDGDEGGGEEGGEESSSEGENEGENEGDGGESGEYGEYEGSDEGDGEGEDNDYARRMREQREAQRRAAAAAEMERATAVREIGGLAGKTLTLSAGTYVLETEHSRGDVAIRYDVRIGVRTLAPGVVLSVPVPGRVDVAMPAIANAQAGLLRIKTRGDVDVRCRLRTPDGTLVAESADSGADWNCALAVPLGAGKYTLSIEAETLQAGSTELSASFLEAKETGDLKDGDKFTVVAKVAAAPIAPADANVVHDVVMTSAQDFSCAVQDDKGALLDRKVSVRECRFLLWPGEEKRGFRVFVWTPDRKADVKVSLKRRSVRGFSGGGLGDDVVGRAKIDTRARYATGPSALCRPVRANGGVLTPCNGAASFVPGEVLVATTESGGGRIELSEQVAQLAAQTTEKRALTSTRAAERQRTRNGEKAVHLVEVSAPFGSASSPSCSIDGGLATHDAAVCAAATGPVEESTLAAWTRSGAQLDATIARRAVPWPKEAKPLTAGRSSLSWADESARFTLPNDGFRLQLALPAGGWAVLLDGANVRDVCAPHRAPTPDRTGALSTCILRGRGGELFIASPAGVVERQARVDLLVLATAEAPRALVGVRETKPSSPGRERVLVASSSTARMLRVEGKGVLACAIHLEGGAHVAGCTATLPANQGAEVRIEHDDRPWRIFTHAPNDLASGRYGALPTSSPSSAASMGTAMALAGNVVDKVLELKSASAVRVRASSGVCAVSMKDMRDSKGWRVVDAQGLGGGCDLVRVMPAGTHRVTVRGFGTAPLGGNVNVSAEPVLALEEGVNPEALVGSGDARTYRFVVAGEGEIGVGLQTDADTLTCALFTEAQELVDDGCHQFHRRLGKGTYYLRVEAPDDTAPRRFKPVIFGLKGSVIDVPDAWLREFFVRAGVAKSDRSGRAQ